MREHSGYAQARQVAPRQPPCHGLTSFENKPPLTGAAMRRAALGVCFALTVVACGSKSPITPSPPMTRIISLSGNLDFGTLPINQSVTSTLTIRSNGNAPLIITGITWFQNGGPDDILPADVIPNWRSGTIQPGASQEVVVRFTPRSPVSYSGTITVNGDVMSGTTTIQFTGAGR